MVTSSLKERLYPSREEFGIWVTAYHKTAQQFGGIEEHQLTIPFKHLDFDIATHVSRDRLAVVVVRGYENDRTILGQPARCVRGQCTHHPPVISVRLHHFER